MDRRAIAGASNPDRHGEAIRKLQRELVLWSHHGGPYEGWLAPAVENAVAGAIAGAGLQQSIFTPVDRFLQSSLDNLVGRAERQWHRWFSE